MIPFDLHLRTVQTQGRTHVREADRADRPVRHHPERGSSVIEPDDDGWSASGVQLRELLVVIRGHNGQVNLLRGAVSLATITETGLRSTLPSEARPFTPHAFLNRAINSSSSA